MKFFSSLCMAFQVFFYKGSRVPTHYYEPLLDTLRDRFKGENTTFEVLDYSLWKRNRFTRETILVGHSFGGYAALLDGLQEENTIRGIVLLNSHFNSKGTAMYPRIKQSDVHIPVMTIGGQQDERLSVRHVLSDLWEKNEDGFNDKFYKIYPEFSHFSGVDGKKTPATDAIATDIECFIQSVHQDRLDILADHCTKSEKRYSFYELADVLPRVVDYNKSLHVMDALFKIVTKAFFWKWLHHVLFILDKPTIDKNMLYTTNYDHHIFIKSCHTSVNEIKNVYKQTIPDYPTEYNIISLPRNLCGIYQWLFIPLQPFIHKKDKKVYWPIFHLQVNNETSYYKVLHPRYLLLSHLQK